MVRNRSKFRYVAIAAIAAALVFPAAAFADRGLVLNDATFNGQSLKGMTETQARDFIRKSSKVSVTDVVVKKTNQKTYKWPAAEAKKAVTVNVQAMVDQAYRSDVSTTTPYAITPAYSVNKKKVESWVKNVVVKKATVKPVNATYYPKSRKLKVKSEKKGYTVNVSGTVNRITTRILNEASGDKPGQVWLDAKLVGAKVTRKNVGKGILVVKKTRWVYLYENGKIKKKYRCAIGTPSYPTPNGSFQIVAKRNRPTWINPAPKGWGSNMPARIKPGSSNPLGLRALNLNASGIRIHGTNKLSSIGTAASHGCIRLTNKNVVDLYKRVKVGTPVFIVK